MLNYTLGMGKKGLLAVKLLLNLLLHHISIMKKQLIHDGLLAGVDINFNLTRDDKHIGLLTRDNTCMCLLENLDIHICLIVMTRC